MKTYNFTIGMTGIGKGYVEAETLEEAKEKISKGNWNDIYDEVNQEYGELIDIYQQ